MISFVSSVCPAPNVERDEDLISTFKKGKKQKNNMVKNVCLKFTYFLLLLKVGHLVEKQQAGDKTNKELISFKIFW